MSVLQHTVQPGSVCSRAACPAPERYIIKQSVLPLGLEVSFHSFAVPEGVWPTAACAAPAHVCLQKPVIHLYISELCAAPGSVSLGEHVLHLLLCFFWKCVYKSFCAAPMDVMSMQIIFYSYAQK